MTRRLEYSMPRRLVSTLSSGQAWPFPANGSSPNWTLTVTRRGWTAATTRGTLRHPTCRVPPWWSQQWSEGTLCGLPSLDKMATISWKCILRFLDGRLENFQRVIRYSFEIFKCYIAFFLYIIACLKYKFHSVYSLWVFTCDIWVIRLCIQVVQNL